MYVDTMLLQRAERAPLETDVIYLIFSDVLSWKQRKLLKVLTLGLNRAAQSSKELSLEGSLWLINHKSYCSHQQKKKIALSQSLFVSKRILFFSKSLQWVLDVQIMAIIYAEILNHQWLNLPKIPTKSCNIIPVYTAQQTEARKG